MDAIKTPIDIPDPTRFQDERFVPGANGDARFGDIVALFQRKDFTVLNPELLALVRGRKPLKGRLSHDHIFVTGANTPWRNNLLKRFYAICKKAGIEDAKPLGSVDLHSLRVTFTTLAIGHGADPKSIQKILGHSTLALTMSIYTKSSDRSKRTVISAIPFAKTSEPDHIISMQECHKTPSTNSGEAKTLCFSG